MKSRALLYTVTSVLMMLFTSAYDLSGGEHLLPYTLHTSNDQLKNIKVLPGDIVFRLGHGFISESMRKFSLKDPRYSHAGIIGIEKGRAIVYHLLGGESSLSVIRKESLQDFCSPEEAASFAVYRTALTNEQVNLVDSLNHYYFKTKLPYDSRFDLSTDSAMYCTEYVYKVLSHVCGKNILISSSILSGQRYIACDDIYLYPAMHKVFSFDYE
jgi:hypothetical protein